jgi:hypothetical protein
MPMDGQHLKNKETKEKKAVYADCSLGTDVCSPAVGFEAGSPLDFFDS